MLFFPRLLKREDSCVDAWLGAAEQNERRRNRDTDTDRIRIRIRQTYDIPTGAGSTGAYL